MNRIDDGRGSSDKDIVSHDRRIFLQAGLGAAVLAALQFVPGCKCIAEGLGENKVRSIEEQRAIISRLNKENPNGVNWNVDLIVRNLTEGLDEEAARRKLFAFAQSFPYELRHYESKGGTELYDSESGDCRHKREALYALFEKKGFEVRRVAVFFDWADLPIPKEILAVKKHSGTKGFHSGLEVKIDGEWVYVDPTWDLDMARIGFPVTENWDGRNPTKEVTSGNIVKHPHGSYEKIEDLYQLHKIPWPRPSETVEFNERFNTWLAAQRVGQQEEIKE